MNTITAKIAIALKGGKQFEVIKSVEEGHVDDGLATEAFHGLVEKKLGKMIGGLGHWPHVQQSTSQADEAVSCSSTHVQAVLPSAPPATMGARTSDV